MNRQRGIAEGWLALIGLVLIAGLGVAGALAVNRHDAAIDKRAYARGVADTTARFNARDNADLQAKIQRIAQLEQAAREAERKHAEDMAAQAADLEKRYAARNAQKDDDIDRLHAGNLQLRVQLARAEAAAAARGSAGAETGAGTGQCDAAPTTGLLSQDDAAFLLGEARRADDVVDQLTAAQAVIRRDRETCNGTP